MSKVWNCMGVCSLLLAGMLLWVPHSLQAQQSGMTSDTTYVVKSGDTLYSIAQRVGASVQALQAWNDMDDVNLAVGDTLRVRPLERSRQRPQSASPPRNTAPLADSLPPVNPNEESSEDTEEAPSGETTAPAERAPPPSQTALQDSAASVRVARPEGATWIDLALRTGVSADSLWRWNDRPSHLPDEVTVPAQAARTMRHTVAEGETLYRIAGEYGVSVRALQVANDLDDATDLRIGRDLRIPGREPTLAAGWAAPDTVQVATFPSAFAGRLTASGVNYDPEALVGSHPTLPYDSVVLLSHPANAALDEAQHVFVRIIDRSVNGPEVSSAAAEALGISNTQPVGLRIVWRVDS